MSVATPNKWWPAFSRAPLPERSTCARRCTGKHSSMPAPSCFCWLLVAIATECRLTGAFN